jgi:hypothetical protein
LAGLAYAVGVAGGDDDGGVVQEAAEDADGCGVFGQEPAPFSKDQCEAMARDRALVEAEITSRDAGSWPE